MLFSQATLGGRDAVGGARVERNGGAERTGECLEATFDDMVIVAAVNIFDMQRQTGMLRESAEPFLEEFGIHIAELVAVEFDLPDEIGAAGDVERDAR